MSETAQPTALQNNADDSIDGVRMTWNTWPHSKLHVSKLVIPLALSFSPLHPHPAIPTLPYAPLRCRSCSNVLNPFCRVDFTRRLFACPFCHSHNNTFPPNYSSISETFLPPELHEHLTTCEYTLPSTNPVAPRQIHLFVLDTCLIKEELEFVKSEIKRALTRLPENASVGFISFGARVNVHGLGFSDIQRIYLFRGDQELEKETVMDQLGLKGFGSTRPGMERFLLPASDCEYPLTLLLDELEPDEWPVEAGQRSLRCTGAALNVVAGLLGACSPSTGARIMAFVGGPCTQGPGKIVSTDLSEPVRSHKDLDKGAAPHFSKAVDFYSNLAKQLVNQGHILDVFASALDQVGIAEMKVIVERTGGLAVMAESFGHPVFKDSFRRLYEDGDQSLGLSFNGTLEISCSKDVQIQGIIGPCTSLEKKGPSVADTVIGEGKTTSWKMCGLDQKSCFTVFFDISQNHSETSGSQLYLQFQTSYQNHEGLSKLRVTTISRKWIDGANNLEELIGGFDQETAAVVMARLTSERMEKEEDFDAVTWLDHSLIRFCSKFGDYQKNDPDSFTLTPWISLYPQFMFNLRRSQFVQVFYNSPDETAYFRMLLNRENITNSVVMIQPSLISYSFNSLPSPALLDVASIAADRILLLDSYFSVVIFHGMTVAQWRNLGYQNHPEQQAFAQLLQAPCDDAQMLIHDRFPVPRLVVCDQYGSQARFLLAKVNPSATYNSAEMETGSDVIFTDDASLQKFFEYLKKLVVQT